MTRWAIDQGCSFFTLKSDRKRTRAVCKALNSHQCPFDFLILKRGDLYKFVRFIAEYTCPDSTHRGWKRGQSVAMFSRNEDTVAAIVSEGRAAKPRIIKHHEKYDHGHKVTAWSARRALRTIQKQLLGDEVESFRRIPSLLMAFRTAGAKTGLQIDKDNCFLRCWVLPKADLEGFNHCRNFVAVDGAHTKGDHSMTLLAMTTLDGNGQTFCFAWALVSIENTDNWLYFHKV